MLILKYPNNRDKKKPFNEFNCKIPPPRGCKNNLNSGQRFSIGKKVWEESLNLKLLLLNVIIYLIIKIILI